MKVILPLFLGLACAGPALAGLEPPRPGDPAALLAWMSGDEREQLRRQWQDLPPENREALRRRMLDNQWGMPVPPAPRKARQEERRATGDDESRPRDERDGGYGRGYEDRYQDYRDDDSRGRGGRR